MVLQRRGRILRRLDGHSASIAESAETTRPRRSTSNAKQPTLQHAVRRDVAPAGLHHPDRPEHLHPETTHPYPRCTFWSSRALAAR